MGNLISDILRDPSEYESALVFLGVLLSVWFAFIDLSGAFASKGDQSSWTSMAHN